MVGHQEEISPLLAHCLYKCASCKKCILVSIEVDNPARLDHRANATKRLDTSQGIYILDVWPKTPKPEVPEHINPRVAELFLEAEQNLIAGHLDSSVASFRKCLELALRDLTPDVEAFKLHARIRKLREMGVITESIKNWADSVRELGNDGVHCFDKPVESDVRQMYLLIKYLLIYLFTLPKKVELAKQGKEKIL